MIMSDYGIQTRLVETIISETFLQSHCHDLEMEECFENQLKEKKEKLNCIF